MQYEEGLPGKIYSLTAGQPFYTQVFCQALVDHLNEIREHTLTGRDLQDVIDQIIENALGFLRERGILLIPDLLANAGGVTCSYFEQVQCNTNYFWEKDEVLGKLDNKMTSAFIAVSDLAAKRNLSMRDAAYLIAVNRVATACMDRGWV